MIPPSWTHSAPTKATSVWPLLGWDDCDAQDNPGSTSTQNQQAPAPFLVHCYKNNGLISFLANIDQICALPTDYLFSEKTSLLLCFEKEIVNPQSQTINENYIEILCLLNRTTQIEWGFDCRLVRCS